MTPLEDPDFPGPPNAEYLTVILCCAALIGLIVAACVWLARH